MGYNKSGSKREIHSNIEVPQEIRKLSNKQSVTLKGLEKEEQTQPKARRKEMIKVRVEITDVETKKTQKPKNKPQNPENISETDFLKR